MEKRVFKINEPWFTAIKNGEKTVEGRCGHNYTFSHLIGNFITFINEEKNDQVDALVTAIHWYENLYQYLDTEGLGVLPGITSISEAIDIYHKFYTDEQIKARGGICAIIMQMNKLK